MANSKVQLADGTVLIDLTGDTVSPEALVSGTTAHDAAGNSITGAFEEQDPTVPEWAKQPTKPVYTASEVGAIAYAAQIKVWGADD